MADENTYDMLYKCCNCYTKFQASVPIGVPAIENGGKCPHCGVKEFVDDDTYYTHKVMGAPVLD